MCADKSTEQPAARRYGRREEYSYFWRPHSFSGVGPLVWLCWSERQFVAPLSGTAGHEERKSSTPRARARVLCDTKQQKKIGFLKSRGTNAFAQGGGGGAGSRRNKKHEKKKTKGANRPRLLNRNHARSQIKAADGIAPLPTQILTCIAVQVRACQQQQKVAEATTKLHSCGWRAITNKCSTSSLLCATRQKPFIHNLTRSSISVT